MLHAGVADRRMWRDTLSHFSGNYRSIAYDRRGYGDTRSPDESFRHIDDLHAVIDHSGDQAPVLIGCSQGGLVAIDYALAHPGNVTALVLVATAVSGAPPPEAYPASVVAEIAQLDEAEEKGDIEQVNAIEARLWLDGPLAEKERVSGQLRQLFLDMNGIALRHARLTYEDPCPSAMDRLGQIGAPTLLVWGELDFPHIQDRSRLMAKTIPGAQSLVMTRCAHLPCLEKPAAFNSAVAAFLATLPERSE